MSLAIEDLANEEQPTTTLSSVSDYITADRHSVPIDMFKSTVRSILDYGTEQRLAESEFLGRLLLLGLVSACEGYFRSVLSMSIEVCPISQAAATAKNVNLGGLLWHGQTGFSRGAFENLSFASRKELVSAFKEYLNITLDEQVFGTILDEYEKVCHLRHGIVHGDGFLPGKNAIVLGVAKSRDPVKIVVKYRQLQDVAAVATTLVFTANRFAFGVLCRRWATDWRRRPGWDARDETAMFNRITAAYRSKLDWRGNPVRRQSATRCMALVRNHYGI